MYDVKALFKSVSVDPTINIFKNWNKVQNSPKRTSMSIQDVMALLEFCIRNTYFVFQDRFY